MSKELADIVAIVDMDGFTINKKFFCKELGFLKVGNAAAQSFFFDIGLRWANLTTKDKKLQLCQKAYSQTTLWCAAWSRCPAFKGFKRYCDGLIQKRLQE